MGVPLAKIFLTKVEAVTCYDGEHSIFNTGKSCEVCSSYFLSSWYIHSNHSKNT